MSVEKLTVEQLEKRIQDTKAAETELQTHSIDKIYEIVSNFDNLGMLEKNGKTIKAITFEINKYLTENIYN
jgi:hypothetical protein